MSLIQDDYALCTLRFVPGSLDEAQLKVSLQDLLNADSQGITDVCLWVTLIVLSVCTGRWWVVGSAWTGRDTNASNPVGVATNSESWVVDLARKQRMNTDIRKKVFSVIMTSEVSLAKTHLISNNHFQG